MGMFDTIQIDPALLPVSKEEQDMLSSTDFQTKSLDNALFIFRITNEGFLEYWATPRQFGSPVNLPIEAERWKRINDIHGYVSFYTSVKENDEWYEFVAKFTDGQLVEIFQNKGHRYEGNRRDDY